MIPPLEVLSRSPSKQAVLCGFMSSVQFTPKVFLFVESIVPGAPIRTILNVYFGLRLKSLSRSLYTTLKINKSIKDSVTY